jgi:hypothetical protein
MAQLLSLLSLLLVGEIAAPAAVKYAKPLGDRRALYSRPQVDDRYRVAEAAPGESCPVLRTLAATGYRAPFHQVLCQRGPAWLYGDRVEISVRPATAVSSAELAEIVRAQRTAEQVAGDAVRALLTEYNGECQRLASLHGLSPWPGIELSSTAGEPLQLDLLENALIVHLRVTGRDRHLQLPRSDRLLFQALCASGFDLFPGLDLCRLTVEYGSGSEAEVAVPRTLWQQADDLSLGAFWKAVDKKRVDELWQAP